MRADNNAPAPVEQGGQVSVTSGDLLGPRDAFLFAEAKDAFAHPQNLPKNTLAPAWASPGRARLAMGPDQRSPIGAARLLADWAPAVAPVGAGGAGG